ncbi:SDR family oxidoreductase [Actinomadura sp. WMMB 499]|uniref:SDR family oxidoreductase n=1 Tax=Actinomadura sp. WMMB 499 TaxID=1219491 RepID=UPI001C3FAF31|nr:SDR family oxidoreductase [Actinomadura sp. WMMB 499]
MASEFALCGIRVNALAPGTVNTDMVRNSPPEFPAVMEQSALQKRTAAPDEMVGPALFLASDASSFVAGQVVIADGRLVPRRPRARSNREDPAGGTRRLDAQRSEDRP